ncbi:hypothetical protein K9N68_04120 [Kovacikia minuta CCNUW1]|uniref:SGNH/GDSL hydrolase family protein n=1 Tax=Kovacikia minuta TaxID=2931930 RepID=UPI001CC9475B|nr:hypothetical protein [Kovacikia minuta]UBF27160.1 hypothetical protein K9N68_04120 [Kovacikia minuta CCNUW1]
MRRYWLGVVGLICTLFFCTTLSAQAYPSPPPPTDPSILGSNIQRSMGLMATSTPNHRNTVRILFYGQSLTKMEWANLVADDLRARFPYANLIIKNRAIGGCASQCLVGPAEHDLYPFYPDLLILHVFGSHIDYEKIIRKTRSTTTADILLLTDPYSGPSDWSDKMSYTFLPKFAATYACGLVDLRRPWLQYLREQGYKPEKLLQADGHQNKQGNFLIAELVKRYLVYRPNQVVQNEPVKTFVLGKDISFEDGKLTLRFVGNRIDAISAQTKANTASSTVYIDGSRPSEFPELYSITRPNGQYGADWSERPPRGKDWPWEVGAILHVRSLTKLQVEDWTATITRFRSGTDFDFTVAGSVTGLDGSGSYADNPFVSKSGRVVIDQSAWWLDRLKDVRVTDGFTITWSVIPNFVDTYTPPKIIDPALEQITTIAQGLKNQEHTLEILSNTGQPLPIKAIRVYRPTLK